MRATPAVPRAKANHSQEPFTPAVAFQAVSFFDSKADRQVVLLYALGQDGVIREFRGAELGWLAFPIRE